MSRYENAEVVLLVEDETGLRRLMTHVLAQHGYEVIEAENGRAALSILAEPEQRIDVIVTDVVMPWLSGPELIEQIRATGRQIPIVCTSGFVTGEEELNVRPDALLAKPFTVRSLIETIRRVIDSATRTASRAS